MSDFNEREYIAQKITERMAAMLFIIGGRDMITAGYMGFDKTRPYLTQKGCDLFRTAMDMMPDTHGLAKARE